MTMDTAFTLLALLLIIVTGRAALFVWRIMWPARIRPAPPVPQTLEHRIGTVIATGMDRVDQLRWTGADAFETLMPLPNGECWSVMVRRFPDEPSARATIGRRAG